MFKFSQSCITTSPATISTGPRNDDYGTNFAAARTCLADEDAFPSIKNALGDKYSGYPVAPVTGEHRLA